MENMESLEVVWFAEAFSEVHSRLLAARRLFPGARQSRLVGVAVHFRSWIRTHLASMDLSVIEGARCLPSLYSCLLDN